MPAGRPTKYDPLYIDKVDDYLDACQDQIDKIVRQANIEKGYEMYENKLKVKLPTTDGFARFIGVARSTLYKWEQEYPEFSDALEKVRVEQHERLLNMGLSGDYNPTIAKLVLSANHGYKEKTDVTSYDQPIQAPILAHVRGDNRDTEPPREKEED